MNLDFSDIKVLVIGDFMIDHYIIGESNRMSPEAPVPVVVPKKEEYSIPGGAGNVNEYKRYGITSNMFRSYWK